MSKSGNKQAVIDLYSELLGAISGKRFLPVIDLFLQELDDLKEARSEKQEIFARGMRFIVLKVRVTH